MSARELEEFIGLIEKAESSVSASTYLTDIYSSSNKLSFTHSHHVPPVPRLSFPLSSTTNSRLKTSSKNTTTTSKPSTISTVSNPVVTSCSSPKASPLRHPPFGRVIAKDLSPAITPESSPVTRKKVLSKVKNKKPISKKEEIRKTNPTSCSSRSSTPSPPRTTLPVPQPVPKLTLKKKVFKESPKKTVNLKAYEKSLQLIGITLTSRENEETAELDGKNEEAGYRLVTRSPTLKTRLKERTQSLSDIKRTIDDGLMENMPLDKFKDIKKNLCNAVFEEWYFKKLSLEVEQKNKLREEKAKKELEFESKREKADANFKTWLQSKKVHRSNSFVKESVEPQLEEKSSEQKEIQLRKETEWLEKKNKELKERRRLEKQELKRKEELENEKKESKQRENAKHFEEWSKVWSKKMKEKRLKEKERRLKEIEDMKERKEIAELSFKAWISKKKSEKSAVTPQETVKEVPKEENQDANLNQRNLKSQEAFTKWLESLELRDEVRTAEEEFQLREMWKPPWYPPGL